MYATRDNLPVHNAPYGKAKITERIEKTETEVRVVGYAINAFGNKWYKTSSGGWIVYDYLTSDIPKKEESKDAKRNDISFSDLKSSFNGKDSAMIQISCNRPTGLYVEECGLYFGADSIQKVVSEVPNNEAQNYPNYFNIFYDVKQECGVTLQKGKIYSYQFYVIVDGIEYASKTYRLNT